MSKPLTLYYAPAVCSLAPHIVLHEIGVAFELVRVDLRTRKTSDGRVLADIHTKDSVPVLALADGSLLTETATILLYLADLRPELGLAPPPASPARVRAHELLGFLATELHKGFAPFTVMANPSDDSRRWAAARLAARVAVLEAMLGERSYLGGEAFAVADAYAYWALGTYTKLTRVPLGERLRGYVDRVGQRPSVAAALTQQAA